MRARSRMSRDICARSVGGFGRSCALAAQMAARKVSSEAQTALLRGVLRRGGGDRLPWCLDSGLAGLSGNLIGKPGWKACSLTSVAGFRSRALNRPGDGCRDDPSSAVGKFDEPERAGPPSRAGRSEFLPPEPSISRATVSRLYARLAAGVGDDCRIHFRGRRGLCSRGIEPARPVNGVFFPPPEREGSACSHSLH